MPIFHNKLVRDRIPERIESSGQICHVEVLSHPEFEQALRQKLIEEAQEVATATTVEQLVQELADVREVLDALIASHDISEKTIAEAQRQKREERGGFQQRLKLLWTEPSSKVD